MTSMDIDIDGLVRDGHLDLESAFADADWHAIDPEDPSAQGSRVSEIAVYAVPEDGSDDESELTDVAIVLETATVYGITSYRWCERWDDGDLGATEEFGPPTLDREEVVRAGMAHATAKGRTTS